MIAAPGTFDVIAIAPPSPSSPRNGGLFAPVRQSSWSLRVSAISRDCGFSWIATRVSAMQVAKSFFALATAAENRCGPGSFGYGFETQKRRHGIMCTALDTPRQRKGIQGCGSEEPRRWRKPTVDSG